MRILTTEERRLILLPLHTGEPPMATDAEFAVASEMIRIGRADLVEGRYFKTNDWGYKALRIDGIIRGMNER